MELNRKITVLIVLVVVTLLVIYAWRGPQQEEQEEKEQEQPQEMKIRRAAVSGTFYPSSPGELKALITSYIDQAPYLNLPEIHGIVCPHAGYIYSGPVAGYSYKQLSDQYDTVIIMGPSHYVWFKGASIPDCTHYETPLGLVRISEKVNELKNPIFVTVAEAHTKEHCIEVQLPFLQSVLTDFEVIPLVLGDVNPEELASALEPYIDERTLVIASSDLSHYYPYEKAVTRDQNCTEAVPGLDFEKIQSCEACGIRAVLTLMHLAREQGWQGKLLDYRNSGDTAGGKDRVVGYMAAAYYGSEEYLNEEEQEFLLHLARQTLEKYLTDGTLPEVDESQVPEKLKQERACFVTLNKKGMLRGCIGNLTPEKELYKSVIENAVNAAVRDPRFNPVVDEELPYISLEISVLSLPQEISYTDSHDLISKIKGKGVTIAAGFNRATFLPQVWEQLPDPEEFLSHLCMKAGLPSDFWKGNALKIEVYTAQVFGEE